MSFAQISITVEEFRGVESGIDAQRRGTSSKSVRLRGRAARRGEDRAEQHDGSYSPVVSHVVNAPGEFQKMNPEATETGDRSQVASRRARRPNAGNDPHPSGPRVSWEAILGTCYTPGSISGGRMSRAESASTWPMLRAASKGLRRSGPRLRRLLRLGVGPGPALRRIAADAAGGERVLEIGVGTGLSLPLYPAGCGVVGIDISGPMLDRARTRLKGLGARASCSS